MHVQSLGLRGLMTLNLHNISLRSINKVVGCSCNLVQKLLAKNAKRPFPKNLNGISPFSWSDHKNSSAIRKSVLS